MRVCVVGKARACTQLPQNSLHRSQKKRQVKKVDIGRICVVVVLALADKTGMGYSTLVVELDKRINLATTKWFDKKLNDQPFSFYSIFMDWSS